MTLSVALVQVGLRLGRWLLPLLAVVLVSVTLAYAITGTVAAAGILSQYAPTEGPRVQAPKKKLRGGCSCSMARP